MPDRLAAVCSACGARFAVPSEFAGRRATCRKCGEKFTVSAAPISESGPLVANQPPRAGPVRMQPIPAVDDATDIAAEMEQKASAGRGLAGTATASADEDVLGWLNAAPDELSDPAAIPPPRPKVLTTAEWVGGTPRSGPGAGTPSPRPIVH